MSDSLPFSFIVPIDCLDVGCALFRINEDHVIII